MKKIMSGFLALLMTCGTPVYAEEESTDEPAEPAEVQETNEYTEGPEVPAVEVLAENPEEPTEEPMQEDAAVPEEAADLLQEQDVEPVPASRDGSYGSAGDWEWTELTESTWSSYNTFVFANSADTYVEGQGYYYDLPCVHPELTFDEWRYVALGTGESVMIYNCGRWRDKTVSMRVTMNCNSSPEHLMEHTFYLRRRGIEDAFNYGDYTEYTVEFFFGDRGEELEEAYFDNMMFIPQDLDDYQTSVFTVNEGEITGGQYTPGHHYSFRVSDDYKSVTLHDENGELIDNNNPAGIAYIFTKNVHSYTVRDMCTGQSGAGSGGIGYEHSSEYTQVFDPEMRNVRFTKNWTGDDERPHDYEVTVHMMGSDGTDYKAVLNRDNGWSAIIEGVYMDDGWGNEITYEYYEECDAPDFIAESDAEHRVPFEKGESEDQEITLDNHAGGLVIRYREKDTEVILHERYVDGTLRKDDPYAVPSPVIAGYSLSDEGDATTEGVMPEDLYFRDVYYEKDPMRGSLVTVSVDAEPAALTAVLPGDIITYTVNAVNTGIFSANTGTAVAVRIPEGLEYVPGSATGGAVYDPETGTLTWENGMLEPGITASFSFQAAVTQTGKSPVYLNAEYTVGSDGVRRESNEVIHTMNGSDITGPAALQLVKGSVVYREVQTYHTEYVQEPVYTTVTDAVLPTGIFTAPGDGDYTFTITGGAGAGWGQKSGGRGASAKGTIHLAAGETVWVQLAGKSSQGWAASPGGGDGGGLSNPAGGAYSYIRLGDEPKDVEAMRADGTIGSLLLVAAGGGGANSNYGFGGRAANATGNTTATHKGANATSSLGGGGGGWYGGKARYGGVSYANAELMTDTSTTAGENGRTGSASKWGEQQNDGGHGTVTYPYISDYIDGEAYQVPDAPAWVPVSDLEALLEEQTGGSVIRYDLALSNNGNETSHDTVMSDRIPAYAKLLAGTMTYTLSKELGEGQAYTVEMTRNLTPEDLARSDEELLAEEISAGYSVSDISRSTADQWTDFTDGDLTNGEYNAAMDRVDWHLGDLAGRSTVTKQLQVVIDRDAADYTASVDNQAEFAREVPEESLGTLTALKHASNIIQTKLGSEPLKTVTVKKVWEDDTEEERPETVTIHITGSDGSHDVREISATDGWTAVFSALPYCLPGSEEPITYQVWEDVPEGYESTADVYHKESVPADYSAQAFITNCYVRLIDIPVEKHWENIAEPELQPKAVCVDLYEADGDARIWTDSLILNEEVGWSGAFRNLPEKREGKVIEYITEEREQTGYMASYQTGTDGRHIITNTYLDVLEPDRDVLLRVIKTDRTKPDLDMSGTKFLLLNRDGTLAAEITDGQLTGWVSPEEGTPVTVSGNTAEIRGISEGTYTLREIPLQGYTSVDDIVITVSFDQYPETLEYRSYSLSNDARLESGAEYNGETGELVYTITVPNRPKFLLPEAGGKGVRLIMTMGVLAVLAGVLIAGKTKR